MAIEASRIEVRHIEQTLVLLFRYSMMNDVMRTIKDFGLTVLEQQYGFFQTDRVESARDEKFECLMKLTVRQKDLETVCDRLDKFIEIQQSVELVYYAE
jgi:transcriptional/translational regulatory protein YebC/TACO1